MDEKLRAVERQAETLEDRVAAARRRCRSGDHYWSNWLHYGMVGHGFAWNPVRFMRDAGTSGHPRVFIGTCMWCERTRKKITFYDLKLKPTGGPMEIIVE